MNTTDLDINTNSLSNIYTNSVNTGASQSNLNSLLSTRTTFPLGHNPVLSSNSSSKNLSYDRTFSKGGNVSLLQSKEESAPNIIFETY
jgi:hypothetical protein